MKAWHLSCRISVFQNCCSLVSNFLPNVLCTYVEISLLRLNYLLKWKFFKSFTKSSASGLKSSESFIKNWRNTSLPYGRRMVPLVLSMLSLWVLGSTNTFLEFLGLPMEKKSKLHTSKVHMSRLIITCIINKDQRYKNFSYGTLFYKGPWVKNSFKD